jgi:subtilisin family serine protease
LASRFAVSECASLFQPTPLPVLSPGPHTVVGTQYTGNVSLLYVSTDGWLFLSGTSMAAPHIAGAAAYVADAFNLGTPAQIEQKLRSLFRPYDYLDANLQGVKFKDPDNLPVHSVELQ